MAAPLVDSANLLNERLPLRLAAEDAEKYPAMIELLKRLTETVLSPSGVSIEAHRQLEAAKIALDDARCRHLQRKAIVNELEELLIDYKISKIDQSDVKMESNSEVYEMLQDALTIGSALQHLSLPATERPLSKDATLLGVKHEHLKMVDPRRGTLQQHLQSIQQSIIPELESRLRNQCERLVKARQLQRRSESGSLTLAKASQLPSIIQEELKKLEEEQEKAKKEKILEEKKFWEYYKSLCDALCVSESILSKQRLQSHPEAATARSSWLAARLDAMCLKLRVLKGQLLRDTYSPEAVSALKQIRKQLQETQLQCELEKQQLSQTLVGYHSIGPEFEKIVQEYSQVREEVENKQWALQELTNSMESRSDRQ